MKRTLIGCVLGGLAGIAASVAIVDEAHIESPVVGALVGIVLAYAGVILGALIVEDDTW